VALTVHPVRYGPPALDRLAALVAEAKADDVLAPVTVVVPTNYVGVATRRALGRRHGVVGVSFLTVYRLGELLGAAALAAAGRRPVSTPVVAGAVRQVLQRAPGVFASVREHPSTEEALLDAHRELRDVSEGTLRVLAAASPRAADVVRIHRAVTAALAPQWYDEADLLEAASRALGRTDLGTLIVYLPQAVSLGAGRFLASLGREVTGHVVAGLSGDLTADAGIHRALDRLGVAVAAEPSHAPKPHLPADVRVISAADADDEVRAGVREVVAAARRGVPLERIAVCYATAEPYARLAGEQLDAAGIQRNGRATIALRERVAARTLLGLLGWPDRAFRRDDLFALLAGAPVRQADGWRIPTSAWERISREAGVVAGAAQWDVRLAALAASQRADAELMRRQPDEAPEWMVERAERRAQRAEELRAFALELIGRLDPVSLPSTWDGLARHCRDLIGRYLGGDLARAEWPEAERVAADKVLTAVDRLGGLDAIDPSPSVERFRRTLELELDADLGRVGRLGDGVFVGPVGLALGQDLDVVIVLGMAEGTFPARPVDDALLPDRERARAGGELALAAERVPRQHHELLAALAGAQQAVLLAPRGDLRRSSERVPSRWLLDIVGRRLDRPVWSDDLATIEAPWIEHVPSFAGGVRTVLFPATEQEHNLRRLTDPGTGAGPAASSRAHDAAFRRGRALIRARRSPAFTIYDGNVSGHTVPSPARTGALVSPTRLERWAGCPLRYFFEYVLRVGEVENPEGVLRMSALDKGSLLHATLDRFIREVLDRPEPQRPAPDEPWSIADVERLLAIFDEEAAAFVARGLTGRDLFWRQDRRTVRRDLRELLRRDDERRHARRARLFATELHFGFDDGSPPVAVELPDGRVVNFRGSVDRVDRADDGALVVTDYKTGGATSYSRLSDAEPTVGGTRLQLPVYALAARAAAGEPDADVTAEYWFATTRAHFQTKQVSLTPDVHATVVADIATIVAGIEAGLFPAHPRRPTWQFRVDCPACDPDGVGTGERWHEWTRKKDAPALAGYVALAARQGADRG
jgi:ATP-dependent helicase/nuclease subunit B